MGARVPSFNRGLNKLSKLTQAAAQEEVSSPRPGNVKRNSSNTILTRNASSSALKKNYSETSLNRNQSDTNLKKNKSSTHLPRVASSRHVHKGSRVQLARPKRSISHTTTLKPGSAKSGVRFDLDAEQAEIQADVAQAHEADSSEEEEVPLTPAEEAEVNQVPEEDENSPPVSRIERIGSTHAVQDPIPQFQFPHPQSQISTQHSRAAVAQPAPAAESSQPKDTAEQALEGLPLRHRSSTAPDASARPSIIAKDSDADSITSKLLSRHQESSRLASQPLMSDAEAVFKGVAHPDRAAQQPMELSTPNASGPNLVSRFISTSGGSSNNTPRNSNSLRKPSSEEVWSEVARRNQSLTDMEAGRQHSRTDSSRSGAITPATQPPSRTQQKLWLERDFSNIEPQQGRPPAFLRPNRSFALGLAPGLYPGGSSVTLGHAPSRSLHDQSGIEYRRIRMFQHPIAQGIARLQDTGVTSRTKTPTRTPSAKSAFFSGAGNGAVSEKTNGLSQSWSSRKGNGTALPSANPTDSTPRRKVTFQGLRETPPQDGSPRKSIEDDEDGHRLDRDEAREVCRRLWELQAYASGE